MLSLDTKLTDEQDEILSLANDSSNLQIVAYAGTGKTTTLELLNSACATVPKLCLAFNKRIAEEMTKRMPDTTECRTLNSLGHRVWGNTIPKRVVLDTKKTYNLFKEVIKDRSRGSQKELWDEYQEISTAVGMAKALGYIPARYKQGYSLINEFDFYDGLEDRLSSDGIEACENILLLSIRTAYSGSLDFNDQLYMSALFGGTFPKFPVVMVDECQDLSPVNHEMVRKLAKHARLIAVGDPFQSIYGFRGAKQNGMGIQAEGFNMACRPLSISFRCPEEIVRNARWRVPCFKSNRAGGHVEHLRDLSARGIPDGAAILCRNNAPLFRAALNLISAGRSVSVAGTDIGPKLVGILRRFGDEALSRSTVLGCISDWQARKESTGSRTAADMADCLRVLAEQTDTLGKTIAYADYLFKQEGSIRLSTGHKAKGLEWDTVYHLDPWLLGTEEQELNLRYVIQTRARESYFEVDSKGISYA